MTQDFVTPPRAQAPLSSELEGVLRWSALAEGGATGELLRGPRAWMQRALSLPNQGAFVEVKATSIEGWVQLWCPDPIALSAADLVGALSGPAALALTCLAAEALRPLHDQGAHHGALSPERIGFDAEGVLRIRPALHRPPLTEPDGAEGGRATDCLALGRLLRGLLGGSFEDDAAPLPALSGVGSARAPLLLAGLNRAHPKLRIQPAAGVIQATAALLRGEAADGEAELRALLRARGLGDALRPPRRPVWLDRYVPPPAPPAPPAPPTPVAEPAAEAPQAPDALEAPPSEDEELEEQRLRVSVLRVKRAVTSAPGGFSLEVIPPAPLEQDEDVDDPPTEPGELLAGEVDGGSPTLSLSFASPSEPAEPGELGELAEPTEDEESIAEGILEVELDEPDVQAAADALAPLELGAGALELLEAAPDPERSGLEQPLTEPPQEEEDVPTLEPVEVCDAAPEGGPAPEGVEVSPSDAASLEGAPSASSEVDVRLDAAGGGAQEAPGVVLEAVSASAEESPLPQEVAAEPAAVAAEPTERSSEPEATAAEDLGPSPAPELGARTSGAVVRAAIGGHVDADAAGPASTADADLVTEEPAPDATSLESAAGLEAESAAVALAHVHAEPAAGLEAGSTPVTPTHAHAEATAGPEAEPATSTPTHAHQELAAEPAAESEGVAAPSAPGLDHPASATPEEPSASAPDAELLGADALPQEPEIVEAGLEDEGGFAVRLESGWATEEIPAGLSMPRGSAAEDPDEALLAIEAEEASEDEEELDDESEVRMTSAVASVPVPASLPPQTPAPVEPRRAAAPPTSAPPPAPRPAPPVTHVVERAAPREPLPEAARDEGASILERQAGNLDELFASGQIGVRADPSREQELGVGKWGEQGRSLEEIARDMPATPTRELDLGDEGSGRLSALLAALGLK
ncbi:MAG: hypothetical protein H6741_19625 [Alphaproteobacteria bacterium]|nr:hypothetical protein [Alphaproteobacteria bacterium]